MSLFRSLPTLNAMSTTRWKIGELQKTWKNSCGTIRPCENVVKESKQGSGAHSRAPRPLHSRSWWSSRGSRVVNIATHTQRMHQTKTLIMTSTTRRDDRLKNQVERSRICVMQWATCIPSIRITHQATCRLSRPSQTTLLRDTCQGA